MNLTEILKWRYATKRMNGQKVPADKLERILEAIRLSASSFGLQPYTILVIENTELRKKIQAVAYNQPQITEASHLLVFAGWTHVSEGQVDEFMNSISKERGMPTEALSGYKNSILGSVRTRTEEGVHNWTARQAYIALGTALIAAASEKVDATPMEGFNPVELDKLLDLGKKNLHSLALLTLGYRDEATDPIAKAKKVRRENSKLFERIA